MLFSSALVLIADRDADTALCDIHIPRSSALPKILKLKALDHLASYACQPLQRDIFPEAEYRAFGQFQSELDVEETVFRIFQIPS